MMTRSEALIATNATFTSTSQAATLAQTETQRPNVASTDETLITIIVVIVIVGSLVYITKRKHLK